MIRRSLGLTIAIGLMLSWTSSSLASDECNTRSCLERVAVKKCSQARPQWCVQRAILTYKLSGVQAAWMRRMAECESKWKPHAYYPSKVATTAAVRSAVDRAGTSAGLFGFIKDTFDRSPYGKRSRWRAKWSALAAAWKVRNGGSHEWVCT